MLKWSQKRRPTEVQRFLSSVIDTERAVERRHDERIDIAIVVAVIPSRDGQPVTSTIYPSMTKNISADGVSLIINRSLPETEFFIGFPGKDTMSFVRARVQYREPLALGCQKLGLLMVEVVPEGRFPDLDSIAQRPQSK